LADKNQQTWQMYFCLANTINLGKMQGLQLFWTFQHRALISKT